jgi:GDPmannose 4,6-dehydratase
LRKVSRAIAHIVAGKQRLLLLGNLKAKRDWGYAPEYVEAMWLMLQQDEPRDYVIGTGECHSVNAFVEEAFQYAKLEWEEYVHIDPRLFRPTEANLLVADAAKARKEWGEPEVRLKELVRILVDADIRRWVWNRWETGMLIRRRP